MVLYKDNHNIKQQKTKLFFLLKTRNSCLRAGLCRELVPAILYSFCMIIVDYICVISKGKRDEVNSSLQSSLSCFLFFSNVKAKAPRRTVEIMLREFHLVQHYIVISKKGHFNNCPINIESVYASASHREPSFSHYFWKSRQSLLFINQIQIVLLLVHPGFKIESKALNVKFRIVVWHPVCLIIFVMQGPGRVKPLFLLLFKPELQVLFGETRSPITTSYLLFPPDHEYVCLPSVRHPHTHATLHPTPWTEIKHHAVTNESTASLWLWVSIYSYEKVIGLFFVSVKYCHRKPRNEIISFWTATFWHGRIIWTRWEFYLRHWTIPNAMPYHFRRQRHPRLWPSVLDPWCTEAFSSTFTSKLRSSLHEDQNDQNNVILFSSFTLTDLI